MNSLTPKGKGFAFESCATYCMATPGGKSAMRKCIANGLRLAYAAGKNDAAVLTRLLGESLVHQAGALEKSVYIPDIEIATRKRRRKP